MMGCNFLGAKYQLLMFNLNVSVFILTGTLESYLPCWSLCAWLPFRGESSSCLRAQIMSYWFPLDRVTFCHSVTLDLGHAVSAGSERASLQRQWEGPGLETWWCVPNRKMWFPRAYFSFQFSSKVADQLWKEKQPFIADFLSSEPKY